MGKVMLAKYFERCENEDFSDDGTYFRAYLLKTDDPRYDTRITIAKACGETFLDARLPEGCVDYDIMRLDEEYFKECCRAQSVAGKYNGVYGDITSEELDVWKNDLVYFIDRLKNYPKPKPIIYLNELDGKYYSYFYEKNSYSDAIQKSLQPVYVNKCKLDKYIIKRLAVVD